jgi:peptidoglycan/xylan/chitin deacetylase (PgdA/CDA1 family)
MFFDADIKGADLPPKTLCLTYDDGPGETQGEGPGPRSAALGRYLCDEGIRATFFVIGRHARQFSSSLAEIHRCRHLTGNHTESHPGLVAMAQSGGDVVDEVARADALIRPYVRGGVVFFRPPYGNWREVDPSTGTDRTSSIVAERLNCSGQFADYIGPINWDISAEDFAFWRRGASADEAAAGYLQEIEAVGRGIVLMHDSSEEEQIRKQNRTLEMTRLLVPELRRRGYRFIALEEIPAVKEIIDPSAAVHRVSDRRPWDLPTPLAHWEPQDVEL